MSGEGVMSYPGIMLFGRKIPVPECQISVPECQIPASSQMGCQIQANSTTMNACRSNLKQTEVEKPQTENSKQSKNSSDLRDSKQESLHNVDENESKVNTKPVEDNMETSSTDQDKVFKKPDKILHCPRCNSLETKFCYFNNYNVNQPRHFCKKCQRYWTAGGTMRSVPVGSGRRKNKHVDHQYRHMIVASNGIPTTGLETNDSFRSSTDNHNGTVLKFGSDAPLNESMDSMLNLMNHKRSFDAISINCKENGEEEASLCGSSVTNACTQGNELCENNRSKPLQCYPFPPLVFPLSPSWNNVASMVQSSMQMCNPYSTDPAAMQWYPAPIVPGRTVCPPSIPLQFVHGSYWNGTPFWGGGNGTVSIGSNGCISPSSSTSNSCCSGNGSPPILGKYTRDFVFTDEDKSEMCVFVPKTLRIDDLNVASKCPIGS